MPVALIEFLRTHSRCRLPKKTLGHNARCTGFITTKDSMPVALMEFCEHPSICDLTNFEEVTHVACILFMGILEVSDSHT